MKQYNFYQLIFFLSALYGKALTSLNPNQAVKRKFNLVTNAINSIDRELRNNFKSIVKREETVLPENYTLEQYEKELQEAAEYTYELEISNVGELLNMYISSYNNGKTEQFINYMKQWKQV